MDAPKLFRIFSSFAVLLPIVAGVVRYPWANTVQRQILGFLIYGFSTDMLCWYFFTHDQAPLAHALFNLYSLGEFIFYFYFLNRIGGINLIYRLRHLIYTVFIITWMYIYLANPPDQVTISGLFNASYEVLFVIMSAASLLKFVETRNRLSAIPEFWFTAAIFFYCINVFFVFQLLGSSIIPRIWFVQNIINIITSFFLLTGFIQIGKSRQPDSLSE